MTGAELALSLAQAGERLPAQRAGAQPADLPPERPPEPAEATPAHWPTSDAQWEALLAVARRAMLGATLAARWQAQGLLPGVPAAPRAHLDSAALVAQRLAHEVGWEIRRIAQALAAGGHRLVLLKGAAYLAAGLPPAQGRVFADIDIIVPQADVPAAEHALFAAGWIPAEADAYNQRYYREWMHEIPPLRHALRGTTIDLHHTITPPTSAFNVAGQALLDAALPAEALPGVWVLQPVDMVLHSAVHLFAEGEFDHGLRDLWDMHSLISHFAATDPGFWPALLARAQALRLQVPLHHALTHAGRLFATAVPAAWAPQVAALAPAGPQRVLMAFLLARALEPSAPAQRGLAEALTRWLLYVRSHWLRMPVRLLLPHLVRKAWMRRFPAPVVEPPIAPPG